MMSTPVSQGRDTATDGGADDVAPAAARFPGLRVEAQLGAGGSGIVYRALDTASGRHVALKVLRAGRWGSEAQRTRFRREVEILRRIADPGVVGILADGTTADGAPWFTMELIAGASLQDRLDRGGLPPLRERVAWIRDVARTLARLHAQGVVHRDVKPSNILLQDDRLARLADFGVVLLPDEERLTVGPRAVGTPRFMAPEQLSGTVTDWQLVDVYALGLVLAELIGTGPPDLAYVVRRATATAPRDRYPGAAALADDLERWLSGRAVRRRARALAWRARQAVKTTSLARIAALALLLVLAALVAVRVQAARRDARAEADWTAARPGLDAVWATGDVQAADAWVTRFASDPTRLRTPAAGRAWLGLAALHREAARSDDELAALGRALAATDDPDVQAAAIAAVVAVYRRLRDWPALAHLLAALPGEDIRLDEPLRRAARTDLALAEGDIAAAIAESPAEAPLLAPFAALRVAPPTAIGALDSDGDGALEWVVGATEARDPVRERDEHGAEIWRFGPLDEDSRLRDVGGRGLLSLRTGLWSLAGDGATRLGPAIKESARVGARVFVSPADNPQSLTELVAGAPTPAHAATDALGAFIQGMAAGDVDGDGQPELVAGFGPYGGFLVRAYRVDPNGGPIAPLAGARPGDVGNVAVVATPAGPRIVGLMIRANPSIGLFGEHEPFGEPCGVQTWRHDPATTRLVAAAQYALPPGYCEASTMQTADLDGDGEAELLVNQWSRQSGALLVLRHRDDELTRAFSLPELNVVSVARRRGRDVVLLARALPGGILAPERWLVGVGDQQLPRRTWEPAPIDPGADPTVRLFAACSLDRSAAESSAQRGDPARAAMFLERAGEPTRAARALAEAARAADDAADAGMLAHAVDLAIDGADAPLARELIAELTTLDPALAAAKTGEHAARLTPGWSLDLARPLPPEAQVVVPAALRHDLANAELRAAVPAGIGPILRLPLRATGGPVWLHAAGVVTRTEQGCIADVRIRRRGATDSPYALYVTSTGAGGVQFRGFDHLTRERIARTDVVTPIDLRIDTRANGVRIRGTWNHQAHARDADGDRPQADEAWELVVQGVMPAFGFPGALCELVLRELDLGGFTVDAAAPQMPPPPAAAWAAGAAEPPPGEPADDPVFAALLRIDPSLLARVRAQYGPDGADRLFHATWEGVARFHRDDDRTIEAMLGMGELASVPPAARRGLRIARSQALLRVGRPHEARAELLPVWHDATKSDAPRWRDAFAAAVLLAEIDLSTGDDAGAAAWLRRSVAVVPDPDLAERLLRYRPRLHDLWRRLASP